MKSQFLILLLIPILLIPTISAQSQTELNNTKIIVTPQQDEVVQEEEILEEWETVLSDPKILKQKIKLHNELMSLKPELFKVEKINHDIIWKATHGDEPIGEFEFTPLDNGFSLPVLGEMSFAVHEWEKYIESIKHVIKETKKENKELKEHQEEEKELQKQELQEQQELDKISELNQLISTEKAKHTKTVYVDKKWPGTESTRGTGIPRGDYTEGFYESINDDHNFSISLKYLTGFDDGYILRDYVFDVSKNTTIKEWAVDDPQLLVNYDLEFLPDQVYYHHTYRTDSTVKIKNSDDVIVYSQTKQNLSSNVGLLDFNSMPYGIYTFDIDYTHHDNLFSGSFTLSFYWFDENDNFLTNAEKITHLQKQLEFTKNYVIKNN